MTDETREKAIEAARQALASVLDSAIKLSIREIQANTETCRTVIDFHRAKAVRAAIDAYERALWRPIAEGQPRWDEAGPAYGIRRDWSDGTGWMDAHTGDKLSSPSMVRLIPTPPEVT
jgi:hypothetical protein